METACQPLLAYYKWHARIYDATRWSFLFGRDHLVRLAAQRLPAASPEILEVGCGTGRNLKALAKAFPGAGITGIDLCQSMLRRAAKATAGHGSRLRLVCAPYGLDSLPFASVDLIVFSYALSMFNPGFEAALDAARSHLRSGGLLAVADFHATPVGWFRTWMGVNHVRMDAHLPPALADRFRLVHTEIHSAYAGLWRYFCWMGRVEE
jgi:S-adenosylmethionine-diacylgycerolhomoserine-N-methlytransferase